MKPELRIVWLAALLVPRTSASEVDSISNLRPNNITGLAYYLYRYTGSYYNGTTTIRIEPQDWIEDDRCDTFSSTPIEITYQNSLLGILKSNGYYRETNPDEANTLAFLLKFWEEGLNIEPTSSSSDGPINDISTIASEQMERNAKPINIGYPTFWRINSSHIADSSYSFQGYRNATNSPQWLGFNSSQCESPMLAEYGGWMLGFDPEEDPEGDPWVLNVTDFPRVSARFDDNSASLEIKGMYGGNTDVNENGVKSYLGGPITISFVGQLDEYRSDQILPNTNGTPIWNQTLGYTKTLTGETIIQSAAITASVSIWVLGVGTLVTLYYNI